jgi:hypothetical protein
MGRPVVSYIHVRGDDRLNDTNLIYYSMTLFRVHLSLTLVPMLLVVR